ncbi:MAG: hypothetical protein ABL871_15100 [Terricaulis sp.]
MMRKFMTMFAAAAFALAALTPVEASAQRYRHHDRGDAYGCRNDNNYGCERDRDRRLARNGGGYDRGYGDDYYNRGECYDRQGRNHCYDRHDDDDDAVAAGVIGLVLGAVVATAIANGNNNSRNDGYDDRYDNRGYDNDRYAAPQQQQCTRRERQWDRYANRYVMVDVPC